MPMKRIKMATVMLMMEAVVSRSSTICGIEGRNEEDEKAAAKKILRQGSSRQSRCTRI